MATRQPSRRPQLSSPPPPPPMPPRQHLHGDQRQRPPPPPSPLPHSPPPPPPTRPGQGHRRGPPQRRPPPPTPPPPRQRPPPFVGRQRQRSPLPPSTPPPPPMPPRQYWRRVLSSRPTMPLDPPPTRAREDQPAPGQTPTPNPGPSPGKDIHGMLDKAVADGKLDESQRRQELLATTKLEELSISNASSPPLPQSPSCVMSDLLALKLDKALLSSSFVSSMVPTGLLIKYFVRVDKEGLFRTYPDCGGPFQTLQEAQEAIDSHHVVQRTMMCMDGLSDEERAVRETLYWYHDGTRKHSAEAFASFTTRRPTRELLNALLDRHNEDNDLLGDNAYALKDIVRHNSCFDGKGCIYRSYSHFNLTMKTKGAEDLYFAEVTCMRGDPEVYVLTSICMVKPDDKGECHVCEVKMEDMKHPTDDVYNQGRRPMFRIRSRRSNDAFGVDLFNKLYAVRDEAWLIAEEARVRRMIKEGNEVDNRGGDMIKEGKENRHKLEVDKRGGDMIKEGRENRHKLEVDNRGGGMIKEGKEARLRNEFKELYDPGFAGVKKYVVPARRQAMCEARQGVDLVRSTAYRWRA